MDSTSSYPPLSHLQAEIDQARAELQNLDKEQGQDHYAVKKMTLEHGLASYEEQYKAIEDARRESSGEGEIGAGFDEGSRLPSLPIITNQRPQTADPTMESGNNGFASYAGQDYNTFGGHFASDGIAAAQGRPPSWGFGINESLATTPDATGFPTTGGQSGSGSVSSPDSGFLRPQKRQRESIGFSNYSAGNPHKFIRTTPSPAMTVNTTPTSSSSYDFADFPDDPELLAMMGSGPARDVRDWREEQKEQERMLEARRRQEQADEELARRLAEQDDEPSLFNDFSRPGSSNIPRNTAQAVLDGQGRFRRSMPYPLSSSPTMMEAQDTFSQPSLPVRQETSHQDSYRPIKNEQFYRPQPSQASYSDFIDLENDEQFNEHLNTFGGHPSSNSDPVEIDGSAFGGVHHQNQGQSSRSRGLNDYNHMENADGSSWGQSSNRFGNSLLNTASNIVSGFYHRAHNLVDQGLGNYNVPAGFDGTSVYGSNNAGTSAEIIDLESYDQIPFSAQNVFNRHGLDPRDPANRDLMASYMDRVEYVANDPTRTAAEIKSLLENIRPDEELPPENREGTPEAMVYALMEHQKLGLTWMKSMEEGSNKGGILADAMGLGKTIQALALMVARPSPDRGCKTNLIVCPVALLKQWDKEIQTKLKGGRHQLKVYTLHQSKRHVDWAKLRTFDVVLTTFGTLGTEVKRREGIEMNKRMNPNWRPTSKADTLPLLGEDSQWYRVIIDEAQCIKNKNTKAATGASLLQAKTRFCMTGTPMMVCNIALSPKARLVALPPQHPET